MLLGAAVLVVAVPLLYFGAITWARIADRLSAKRLEPLARSVGGVVHVDPPHIAATHAGRKVRVSFWPQSSIGDGESASWINAFSVAVTDLPGRQNWRLVFHVSGLLGQGPKELLIEVADAALGHRLEAAGALDAALSVCAPTNFYVAVEYDARARVLTCTDDSWHHASWPRRRIFRNSWRWPFGWPPSTSR